MNNFESACNAILSGLGVYGLFRSQIKMINILRAKRFPLTEQEF